MCYKNIDEHKDADGKVYWSAGHNAEPLVSQNTEHSSMVSHGRCCDSCNDMVIQVRMMCAFGWKDVPFQIIDWFANAKNQGESIIAHMKLFMALKQIGEAQKAE
jgi:hypothetical protein